MQNTVENPVFPHILIEKKLKTGAHGCIYLARDAHTRSRCVYRRFSGSPEVYQKLRRVNCSHLPKILDVKEDAGTVYVLEEYIPGDTLAFLLEGKPLAPAQAENIFLQICHALQAIHSIGAVHRDVKPENIIIRGSEAILIDFDASRLYKSESTTDTRVMGTTGYAAPEQYGFSQTDQRTDIYAMGILLNEMLTGQHPSRQLAGGKFRPIIQKCTQINADQRYHSILELIQAVNPPRWKPLRWVCAALVLLTLCGLLLGLGFRNHRQNTQTAPTETQTIAAEPTVTGQAVSLTEPPAPAVTQPPTTAVTQPPTTADADAFVSEPVEITMDPWKGPTKGHATSFQYDLDGDGRVENYLFGVDFLGSPHKNVVYYDRNLALPNQVLYRKVHPCIWQKMSDGTMTPAIDLAQLLTDVQVHVWRVDDFASPAPDAETMEYPWSPCVKIGFKPVQEGTWLYEIRATLADRELTATATTTLFFE